MSAEDASPSTEEAAILAEEAAPSTPARPRRWGRVLGVVGLFLVAAGVLLPIVELDLGTTRARACVASYEEPRGAALPDCRKEIPWFVVPSRVPWTATPARYRAEELQARIALTTYVDTLVGKPDPPAIGAAAEALDAAAQTLHRGSRRLALEDLGRTVGAPNLGRAAELYGDRRTLLARFDRWEDWDQRLRALEAALMEGDLPRASEIARRYAAFDPRDEDLRTAVAATLCLGAPADAKRGVELLTLVQNDRAEHKHEAWSRNWGEVRAVIVACARRAGVTPPPRPERAGAGQGDADEVRAALRLRLATEKGSAAGPGERRDAALAAVELLGRPRKPGARVRLLAAVLASGYLLDAKSAAEMARPMSEEGEPSIVPSPALTAIEWLDERCLEDGPSLHREERCPGPRAVGIQVSGATLEQGANELEKLASEPDLSAADIETLRAAAGAALVHAAQHHAAAGDLGAALALLDRAGDRALAGVAAQALARSNALTLAGRHEQARDEIDRAMASPITGPLGKQITAAMLVQRAELLASLGKRDEAARAAVLADEAAASAGDRPLELHARWTRTALARPPASPLRAPAPSPLPGTRGWPWVGLAGTGNSWLSADAEGPRLLDQALAFWSDAQLASAEDRRALRYAALAHRGDAPASLAAYFTLAAGLLHEGEGDAELWLDVFTTTDARRLPLRSYAWARAESARMRGDAAAAALWATRREALVAVTADPARSEIARYLGL